MNIQSGCQKCHGFFPVKPMELEFFCDKPECQEYSNTYNFWRIKSQRCISMSYFDIWDLDRPYNITENGEILDYERVCRVCGMPMSNKDGKYSVHRRYCQNHNGYELWVKYNWGEVSKKYALKVAEDNKELIKKLNTTEYSNVTVCEICKKLCLIWETYWSKRETGLEVKVCNIHHIYPVHKITMENLYLIWDYSNLKVLCQECHHKQNHFLKRKDIGIKYKEITAYL